MGDDGEERLEFRVKSRTLYINVLSKDGKDRYWKRIIELPASPHSEAFGIRFSEGDFNWEGKTVSDLLLIKSLDATRRRFRLYRNRVLELRFDRKDQRNRVVEALNETYIHDDQSKVSKKTK